MTQFEDIIAETLQARSSLTFASVDKRRAGELPVYNIVKEPTA